MNYAELLSRRVWLRSRLSVAQHELRNAQRKFQSEIQDLLKKIERIEAALQHETNRNHKTWEAVEQDAFNEEEAEREASEYW